jgi:hypothetical protein
MTSKRPPVRKSTNAEERVSIGYVLAAFALTALGIYATLSTNSTITRHEELGTLLVMPSILTSMYELGGRWLVVGCMGSVTVVFFLTAVFFLAVLIHQNRRTR